MAHLVATWNGRGCLLIGGTPGWLLIRPRAAVGVLRGLLFPGRWWGGLRRGVTALDGGRLSGCTRAATTLGGPTRRAATVRRRRALLGLLSVLLVVMGDRDCSRDGHGHFGSQDGGSCFGSDGHGLCAGGGRFGSG
jgi:hypothetical protein